MAAKLSFLEMRKIPSNRSRQVLLGLQWYDHRIHQGIAHYAREHNWHLDTRMVITRVVDPDWRGDGIISKLYGSHDLLTLINTRNVPTVNVGRVNPLPEFNQVVDIELDLNQLFRMVVEDLHARGFRSFALAGWMARLLTRHFGSSADLFRRIVEEKGDICALLPPVPEWMDLHETLERKVSMPTLLPQEHKTAQSVLFLKHLKDLKKPVAILASDDLCAASIVADCQEVGLHIPDEVAVIGVDNIPGIWDSADVPISSVDTDFEAWGYEAAALLDRLMDGKPPPTPTPLHEPREIVTRGSTDFIAVHNAIVKDALLFIRGNAHKGISVAQVVEATPVSRRHLDHLFIQFLGYSISKEIDRVRMQQVKKLLFDTDLTVAEIAKQVGHTNALNLHRSFIRQEGMPPGAYRRQHKGEGLTQ